MNTSSNTSPASPASVSLSSMSAQAKKELLLTLLKEAVDKCYEKDSSLIDRSMERASVARIYYYLQRALEQDGRFDSYYLDGEYNKNKKGIKSTLRCPNGTMPDIILHKRSSYRDSGYKKGDNLLVIEFKSATGKSKKLDGKSVDFIKLEDFTDDDGDYRYFLGVFVKLGKRIPEYKLFQNGRERE